MPDPDSDFSSWAQNFMTYLMAHTADLGLDAGDIAPATAAMGTWMSAYPAHVTAQEAASGAKAAKDEARGGLESVLRGLVNRLQASADVSDQEREAMGITVRDTEPTPVGPPTTRPVGIIDSGERFKHIIEFRDEASPRSKARPDGVSGCEIWMKIGDAPVGPNDVTYLCTDTRTPYMLEVDQAEAGKMAHYMLRWVSTRNEPGPWSETVSATIGG